MRRNLEKADHISATALSAEDTFCDPHGPFFLNGPHSCVDVIVFEFFDFFPVNLKVNRLPMFGVVGVANSFVCNRDPLVVGLEHRVFKEKTQCRHLGDHHSSGTVHLTSEVEGTSITLVMTGEPTITWSITAGGVPDRTESTRSAIILR